MFILVHHNVDARFDPFQQLTGNLPVTGMSAHKQATGFLSHFYEVMLAIKIKSKPGIEPRKKSHLINQALAKLVKIPVNMPVSLEGWIFYSFMEKVVRSPDGFAGKNEEV
jgi:hypothetical protein